MILIQSDYKYHQDIILVCCIPQYNSFLLDKYYTNFTKYNWCMCLLCTEWELMQLLSNRTLKDKIHTTQTLLNYSYRIHMQLEQLNLQDKRNPVHKSYRLLIRLGCSIQQSTLSEYLN